MTFHPLSEISRLHNALFIEQQSAVPLAISTLRRLYVAGGTQWTQRALFSGLPRELLSSYQEIVKPVALQHHHFEVRVGEPLHGLPTNHHQPVPLLLDSESAALSEIHEELQHQLQPVIEPFVKRKYVDTYHAKTQRIVTKWLNGTYPNHLTIRQSHTEKKLHNRTIELLRET